MGACRGGWYAARLEENIGAPPPPLLDRPETAPYDVSRCSESRAHRLNTGWRRKRHLCLEVLTPTLWRWRSRTTPSSSWIPLSAKGALPPDKPLWSRR